MNIAYVTIIYGKIEVNVADFCGQPSETLTQQCSIIVSMVGVRAAKKKNIDDIVTIFFSSFQKKYIKIQNVLTTAIGSIFLYIYEIMFNSINNFSID